MLRILTEKLTAAEAKKQHFFAMPQKNGQFNRLNGRLSELKESGYLSCMEEKSELRESSRIALSDCLGVKPGEVVVIVVDETTRNIGRALFEEAKKLRAKPVYVEIVPGENHGNEPPASVAAALKNCDVFIAPTSKSLTHTNACREAYENGARGATLPTITEEIFVRTMKADYKKMAQRCNKLEQILSKTDKIRVTTPAGTDITFSIKGRTIISDTGIYRTPKSFGNLPGAEVCVSPVLNTAEGTIVVDGLFGSEQMTEPVKLEVKNGMVVSVSGDKNITASLEKIFKEYGSKIYTIAEFGIGANEQAKLNSNPLELEKVLGTVHFGLGDNADMGGETSVDYHEDGILTKPTVYADGQLIMKDGKLLF